MRLIEVNAKCAGYKLFERLKGISRKHLKVFFFFLQEISKWATFARRHIENGRKGLIPVYRINASLAAVAALEICKSLYLHFSTSFPSNK